MCLLPGRILGWDDIGRIIASRMVGDVILLLFAKLRVVRPYTN